MLTFVGNSSLEGLNFCDETFQFGSINADSNTETLSSALILNETQASIATSNLLIQVKHNHGDL